MNKDFKELKDAILLLTESSEKDLEDISEAIDDIIKYKIKDERTISEMFDSILSLEFVDDDKKRKTFYKLSNYCRKFDKKLAEDYDEILEDDMSFNIDDE